MIGFYYSEAPVQLVLEVRYPLLTLRARHRLPSRPSATHLLRKRNRWEFSSQLEVAVGTGNRDPAGLGSPDAARHLRWRKPLPVVRIIHQQSAVDRRQVWQRKLPSSQN